MARTETSYRRIEHHDHAAFLTTASTPPISVDNCGTVHFAPHIAGICRSDLREIAGTRFGRRDFGHELVGTVVSTPPQLRPLEGRTVVFDPHPSLTRRTSGFAELVELAADPRELAAALVPVPNGLADTTAVFAEPLACAVHCVSRLQQVTEDLGMGPHTPVAVLGAGMAGTLIAATLTAQDQPCTLVNPSPERIEFLLDRRAVPHEILRRAARRGTFHRVVLATAEAVPDHLEMALHLLAPDGLLLLFAGTHPGSRLAGVDIDRIRRKQLAHPVTAEYKHVTMAGTYGALRDDFLRALALLCEPPGPGGWSLAVCVNRLTTSVIGLDVAADYLTAPARPGVFGKTLVQILQEES